MTSFGSPTWKSVDTKDCSGNVQLTQQMDVQSFSRRAGSHSHLFDYFQAKIGKASWIQL